MNLFFESVKTKLLEGLSVDGYQVTSEVHDGKNDYAIFENEKSSLKLEYLEENKLFVLERGDAGCDIDDYDRVQSYLFDEDAGDGMRETISVTAEFMDTLNSGKTKPVSRTAVSKKKKDKDSDESSASFFVNRIPSILPECREPLLRHKSHYEQLLPRSFCEEVVTVAVRDILQNNERAKCAAFFELLSNMYQQGDMDTKSIIMQVIMPAVPEGDEDYVEGLVSDSFKKAWAHGKKWFGKDVKPEKETMMAKVAQHQSDTLLSDRARR